MRASLAPGCVGLTYGLPGLLNVAWGRGCLIHSASAQTCHRMIYILHWHLGLSSADKPPKSIFHQHMRTGCRGSGRWWLRSLWPFFSCLVLIYLFTWVFLVLNFPCCQAGKKHKWQSLSTSGTFIHAGSNLVSKFRHI